MIVCCLKRQTEKDRSPRTTISGPVLKMTSWRSDFLSASPGAVEAYVRARVRLRSQFASLPFISSVHKLLPECD